MKRKDIFAAWVATIYLFAYCLLLQFDATRNVGFLLLLGTPIVLVWMTYCILKYGSHCGPDLDDEEFGYQDKSKEELGVF